MPKKFPRPTTSAPGAGAPSSRSDIESELASVTADIAFHGQAEKNAKEAKEKARKKFFALADQVLKLDGLDRQVLRLPDHVGSEVDGLIFRFTPDEWVARDYPGWKIIEFVLDKDKRDCVVIEQDPSAQPYTYVNNSLGLVFGRQRSMVKGGVDVDWLWQEYPEVAAHVTREEVIQVFDDEAAHLYFNEHPESQAVFEQVCYDGTPQMKLASPTKLKDDE